MSVVIAFQSAEDSGVFSSAQSGLSTKLPAAMERRRNYGQVERSGGALRWSTLLCFLFDFFGVATDELNSTRLSSQLIAPAPPYAWYLHSMHMMSRIDRKPHEQLQFPHCTGAKRTAKNCR